ncbi:16S rRNA (guanine(527)-N(7))-methyltransferase RsmG [Alteromonas sp. 1_MG-2023]|uniref:16S rRNA (guanine(527)-N(7))-methyltransferase RsmG n=1 Tax=Alteromonas sp. 1_MG-2023 TaxID=3062669 RepID=UPI0026E3EEAB|nr:16S rRNA (guanine(527)-N(7))-methyltransferase RsmG [Alteromonas sp. 1_MG-2023]MDO6474405.1 16S rRNA (guanine(527)-N(7))-methyltransferase RsmG [Alteromonas sp. 1_MG-2023]
MSNVDTVKLNEILLQGCEKLALDITTEQADKLTGYVQRIDKWNKAYNLTSVRDPEQMMVKHILDSLAVTRFVSGKRVIDVGTGPGLPGMPLAIMLPDIEFTLLDSLGKRVRFMKQCAFELGLTNVTPVHSRVEEHEPAQPYDIVLSRAFASLKDMLHWCQHLVDSSGVFFALKGQFPQSEIDEVSDHFQIGSVEALSVPDLTGERHLVTIRKV